MGRTPKRSALAARGTSVFCLASALALAAPAHADERVWSSSGDAKGAVAIDCGHCGDDVGMMLACKVPGEIVEVTVPWAAARTGKDDEALPVTIDVGAQSFGY